MTLARLAVICVILLLIAVGGLLYSLMLPRLVSAPNDPAVLWGSLILTGLTPVWLFALAWAFSLLLTLEKPTQKP
ncbi:hypothetical protein [Pseudomonas sp. RL]|uniref:hypothetical protein n=1 Tax=Pseudomonas sp. RL TaxID=1452718 RepID=UPI000489531D|nr:hypothetical protein [Pseudomonas sp. RL]